MSAASGRPILEVQDLKTWFFTSGGIVKAVDGVSFALDRGETLGIVGESGSGKSMTALSLLKLVPEPGRIVGGKILLDGQDIVTMDESEVREVRGNQVAMIFQDPMTSMNPVLRVGFQVEEAMDSHKRFTRREAKQRIVPLLRQVRIPAAERRSRDFPHQFSGGMRQRAMIAMGVSNKPSLLIADEPTTALDVTVQAQVISLLRQLNSEQGTAIILITHNMAVVASLCKRVIVMYAGRVVEAGETRQIFKNPQHPYTWSLLRSIPRIDASRKNRLVTIPGNPPDLSNPPAACKFHPRCKFRIARCSVEEPPLAEVDAGQQARCWVLMRNVENVEAG
ncbi:MAG TPA: ABC transporter ATP-binding protein [Candidatus Dormibacteraeota bacterium]|nr:ABC transporter ATP-binding protein [Candidatus Dormibacteraeota bacterium]